MHTRRAGGPDRRAGCRIGRRPTACQPHACGPRLLLRRRALCLRTRLLAGCPAQGTPLLASLGASCTALDVRPHSASRPPSAASFCAATPALAAPGTPSPSLTRCLGLSSKSREHAPASLCRTWSRTCSPAWLRSSPLNGPGQTRTGNFSAPSSASCRSGPPRQKPKRSLWPLPPIALGQRSTLALGLAKRAGATVSCATCPRRRRAALRAPACRLWDNISTREARCCS